MRHGEKTKELKVMVTLINMTTIHEDVYGAARAGNMAAVRDLLDHGADVNMALMGATEPGATGTADIADLALERGAALLFGLASRHISLFYDTKMSVGQYKRTRIGPSEITREYIRNSGKGW